jgi:hypothetical protein
MYDSGAGSTLISHGAIKALGWEDLLVPAEGSYASASGVDNRYVGLLEDV